MSKNKSYRYSFRNQPAIQTLGLITSQQMRDPKSHEILKVFQSVNLFCQDLQCYFLLNLYSNSQPWLAAASASSVPSSLGVGKKHKSHRPGFENLPCCLQAPKLFLSLLVNLPTKPRGNHLSPVVAVKIHENKSWIGYGFQKLLSRSESNIQELTFIQQRKWEDISP